MGIQLKTLSYWLISKNQLEKGPESGIIWESVIVIKINASKKAVKLCSKRLEFEEILKVFEKSWKVESDLMYLSYASVGQNCLKKCKNNIV